MARNSSFERRRAKLADAGFIKEKDYRKYTKAGADRLRRLEPKYQALRNYFREGVYQIYQPKSAKRLRELAWIQPREIQRWKLPYILVHTGRRQLKAGQTPIPNEIKRITTRRGEVIINTTGPTLRIPKIGAKETATRTEQTIQKILDKMGPRSRVRLRLGLSVSHAAYSASTLPGYIRYFTEQYLEQGEGEDFFEGFEIIDL